MYSCMQAQQANARYVHIYKPKETVSRYVVPLFLSSNDFFWPQYRYSRLVSISVYFVGTFLTFGQITLSKFAKKSKSALLHLCQSKLFDKNQRAKIHILTLSLLKDKNACHHALAFAWESFTRHC